MNNLLQAFGGWQPIVDAPVWLVLLLKITAILLAAWLGHLALARTNPRWRVLLWRMTAVGLIVLPAAAWCFPALKIRVEQPPSAKEAVNTPTASRVLAADGDLATTAHGGLWGDLSDTPARHRLPRWPHAPSEDVGSSRLPQPQAFVSTPLTATLITVPMALLAVWLGGIGVLTGRLCLGHYRIGRMARAATQPPPWVHSECLRVARAIGCRSRVEVLQSTAIASPLLCGMFRARLLLPAPMCADSYRADLPAIFAHELAHVRSRDVHWNLGLHLISVALWFHPFAWRMRRAHLAACELVADAISASFVGDAAEYCRTLARVAVHAYASVPATGIAMARRSSISRRLGALKRKVFTRPLRRRSVIAFGCAALLAAGVLGALQVALATPPPAEPVAAGKAEAIELRIDGGTSAAGYASAASQNAKSTGKASGTPSAPKSGLLRVVVLDPQGKPLPDANIHASIVTEEQDFHTVRNYTTDAAGTAAMELPKTFESVSLRASKKSFVTLIATWGQNELADDKALPDEYTFRLERGVTAGGRIVDVEGKPIAGVKVRVEWLLLGSSSGGYAKPAHGDGRAHYEYGRDPKREPVTTDADGRWRIDSLPDSTKISLSPLVFHPDYVSDDSPGGLPKDADTTTAMLRQETAVLILKRGIIAQGRVTDPAGKPIEDALVVRGNDPYLAITSSGVPSEFRTDADGRFRLPAMAPGEKILTVLAPGWAPQLRRVNLQPGLPPQDFRMAPGKAIQLRIVDAAGKPVPEVYVLINGWRGSKSIYNVKHPRLLDTKIPEKADSNGVWEWTWAPDDPVKLEVTTYALKSFVPCQLEIAGGAPPRTVTLKAEHRVTGRVTDALTGKPIPLFNVTPIAVIRKDSLIAQRQDFKAGKDGRLDYLVKHIGVTVRLRVGALGYRTQDGPEFRAGDDAARIQDFPLEPSPPVAGVVVDAAGQPVAQAEVLLATPTQVAILHETGTNLSAKAMTDAGGRFAFPDPGEPFTLLAHADAGFAMADFTADQHDAGALRLQPWASVRGQFRDCGKPIRHATIRVTPIGLYDYGRQRAVAMTQADTDADGRFELPRVPPGPVSVQVFLGKVLWNDENFHAAPSVPLDLQPGQQAELDLGGTGTITTGKVTLTGNVPADFKSPSSRIYLVCRAPGVTPPPAIASLGLDIRNGWRDVWRRTPEGLTYLETLRHWIAKLSPNGTFRISGVPAGEYDLAVDVHANRNGSDVGPPVARKVVRVTVTAADAARGELTLPEISVSAVPIPAAGDTPSLSFQRADGTTGTLADCRGHYTVVHFWTSWCGPCKQQLPEVRQLHDRFAARGLATLGLSLDDDPAAWQAALKPLGLPWPQGRLAAGGDAGVSSLPAYWLLDPAGKIVAKGYYPDVLAAPLAERLR